MGLTAGARLGSCEIVAPIGAGGMGEVYRARDTKLNRDVAIKILPDLFAHDSERVARFTREAQTLAALNHPNIAQIYGILEEAASPQDPAKAGSHDSGRGTGVEAGFSRLQTHVHALVMELVEGDDLSVLIARGAMPLADALPIAKQIADALEAAHDQGVIHRDLKPANIKVRADGTVKVLDFGLAKALDPAGTSGSGNAAHSPTMTARATQMGMIIGTAAYMAPEQAKGKAVDRRADIWAFGVVLYEMITGRRAFPGDDVSEVLASVLKSDPDWRAVPDAIPPSVRRLLLHCLEKDPRKRLSAIGDARFDLDDAGSSRPADHAPPPAAPAGAASLRRWAPWALLVVLAATVAAQAWFFSRPAGNLRPFSFPIEIPVGLASPGVPSVLVSADGTRVVYAAAEDGQVRLFSQLLGELAATPIPGTEGADRPFLSPDGRWVAFVAGERLRKVPIEGGASVDLTTARWGGGSWDQNNRIVYTRSYQDGLWEIDAAGGSASKLTEPDAAKGELGHWWPQVLPDGDQILFTAYRSFGDSTIEVVSRKTKARRVVASRGVFGRYVPTGHLVYAKDESLFVVRMDLASLTMSGGAVPILSDVAMSHGDGYAAFGVAANGTLVYLPSSSHNAERDLVFVTRSGESRLALPNPGRFDHPSLSPDGTRVAVDLTQKGMASDIWVYALDSGRATRITDSPGEDFAASWTPDGRELLYTAEQPLYEIWRRVADASRPPGRLIGGDYDRRVSGVSLDGRYASISSSRPDGEALEFLTLTGKPGEQTYLSGIRNPGKGSFSPDTRWMAYQSDESGRAEVYLQSFPDPTRGRWKLSTDGGSEPLWTNNGREVVYRERDAVMAVTVDPDRGQVGAPRLLFRGPYVFHTAWNDARSYDVSRDGERFLMLRESPERQRRRIIVTLNWFEKLKEKAAR